MVKLRLIKEKNEWMVLPKGTREEGSMYMDAVLYESLIEKVNIMKKKNVDLVILCCGYPGAGKSKLVAQMASIVDPTFTEDRMYQNSKDFSDGVMAETNTLRAHVLDEAWESLSSKQIQRQEGRIFMNLMNTIRQKRLIIFIVLPDFFDLSKNMAIFRSRWLINCYSPKFGDVGKFVAFDRDSKKKLYHRGKKMADYSAHRYDFHGRFTNADSPRFNWHRYETVIKLKAMEMPGSGDLAEGKIIGQRNKLLLMLRDKFNVKTKDLAGEIEMTHKYVTDLLRHERIEQKKD